MPEAAGPLGVTFLGVSTLLFDDGASAILFDGFFSRPSLLRVGLGRIAPDEARKSWMGANGGVGSALFIDGLLAGLWRVEDGRVQATPFGTPTKAQRRQLDAEIERVETLLATP